MVVAYQKLFAFTSESFFAQENDRSSENEAHCVQLQTFLDFAQKVGNVQPFNTTVV